MLKYEIDLERSKVVYENCKHLVQMKMCYNNIFNVVTDYISYFRTGKWKVAYGFVEVMAGLYCRHCFILDENNKVIDPTFFTNSEQYDREYYVMTAFDDVDEYLTALENENYMPVLENYFREQDRQAIKWALDKGYIFVD